MYMHWVHGGAGGFLKAPPPCLQLCLEGLGFMVWGLGFGRSSRRRRPACSPALTASIACAWISSYDLCTAAPRPSSQFQSKQCTSTYTNAPARRESARAAYSLGYRRNILHPLLTRRSSGGRRRRGRCCNERALPCRLTRSFVVVIYVTRCRIS